MVVILVNKVYIWRAPLIAPLHQLFLLDVIQMKLYYVFFISLMVNLKVFIIVDIILAQVQVIAMALLQ